MTKLIIIILLLLKRKKRAAKPKTGGICCLVFAKPMPPSGSNARTAIRWELSGCLSEIS